MSGQNKTLFIKQLRQVERKENKILDKKENTLLKETLNPLMSKIQDKIPDKLLATLNAAFYQGFRLIFNKGTTYIEKTYSKDKLQLEHDLNNILINRRPKTDSIRELDKQSFYSKTINSSVAVIEGGVLGFLGIGLPDIPLIIAVIMRTIYETALSYGYDYESKAEKTYILYLICASLTKGERQKEFDAILNKTAQKIEAGEPLDIALDEAMRLTSSVLSETLLVAKFVQGIPVVGAVGGVVNNYIVRKVGKYAGIKYKKRYLLCKIK